MTMLLCGARSDRAHMYKLLRAEANVQDTVSKLVLLVHLCHWCTQLHRHATHRQVAHRLLNPPAQDLLELTTGHQFGYEKLVLNFGEGACLANDGDPVRIPCTHFIQP